MTTRRTAVVVVGVVTLLSGVLRFAGLSTPREKVFDEVYYASDGCWYAGHDFEECGLDADAERSWVHPPLGKQIIAVGIDAFGNRPFGWRAMAAVAGTGIVALVGILAFLLFGSALWAGVGAILASSEHLLFVQSRIAMLDVFLAFFVVLGFVFLALDRRREEVEVPEEPERDPDPAAEPPGPDEEPRTEAPPAEPPRRWIRPLHLLAGASFGAAMAVKWSGYLALLGGLGLAILWTVRRISERRARPLEFGGLALAFLVVPFAVYALPWIPWLAERSFDLGEWLGHHEDMWSYHATLETVQENGEPIHPYMSRAWSWLLLLRPVAYHWQGDPDCCREIIGMGNPFVFWTSLLVIPYLAIVWLHRRDWRAGLVLVPILAQFLPWLVVSRPLFLFYMTPVTPFLALGLVAPVRDLVRTRIPRPLAVGAAAVVVLVSVGMFVYFFPVLTGAHLSYASWQSRMWLGGWV